MDLTAIVVNYNTSHLLPKTLSMLRQSARAFRIKTVIVDNASRDDSVAVLRDKYPEIELIENKVNVGFGRANNQGLPSMQGRYALLINTDAFVAPETLELTISFMDAHLDCGILGVRLVSRDGSLQPCCRYFPTPLNVFLARTGLVRCFPWVAPVDDMEWDHESVRECDWVPGCYYLVRREVIEQVGLFDPRFFLYYEEVDHCRRAKSAGWKVMYFPETEVVHLGGESAKSDSTLTAAGRQISALQIESELLYFRKHHGRRGLVAHLALTLLGDMVLAAKWLLKWHQPSRLGDYWRHLTATWDLLRRTRWATCPTR